MGTVVRRHQSSGGGFATVRIVRRQGLICTKFFQLYIHKIIQIEDLVCLHRVAERHVLTWSGLFIMYVLDYLKVGRN